MNMRESWEIKRIGDVCKVLDSKRKPITKSNRQSGSIPYYGATGIQDYVKNYIFDGRYLLVGEDGAKWGKNDNTAFIIEGKSWVNNHAHILQLHSNVIDSFARYYLNGKDLNSFITGAVVPKLTQAALVGIPIPVPSLEEQERIVAEFDLLTEIIDKQKQQLKELDNLAQSIFYDMFGSPDANEKEWIMKPLAEIGTIVSGSTPSTSDESNWDGDVNWVTPAELGVQLFYGETRRKITSKAAKSLTIMPTGTLLMSSRAPIGKLAITSVPMCCNQGFKNIVCGNNVNNIYLYYCLMLNINSIKAMGRGATFKEVSKQAVSSFEIMLPPMNLQEPFAQKILSIEAQKESINRSIAESQKLFDYTMDKYFG